MEYPSEVEERQHHRLRLELAGIPWAPMRPHASRHVLVGDRRMHCMDWGPAEAPPILLLHGGGQTCRTWDVVCHVLADRHRCIALDQRGHGDSEWSYEGDYRFSTHAKDIVGFLDVLSLPRIVVVGMSMGVFNALELALAHPERVRALVAVDAGPWIDVNGAAPIRSFMAEAERLHTLDDLVAAALRFNPRRDPRLLRYSLRHNLRENPRGGWIWKTDRRFPVSFESVRAHGRMLETRVSRLACPLLVVRGGESQIMSDAGAERFARAVRNGRWLRIDGAGHTIQGDQPAALASAIDALLTEVYTD